MTGWLDVAWQFFHHMNNGAPKDDVNKGKVERRFLLLVTAQNCSIMVILVSDLKVL